MTAGRTLPHYKPILCFTFTIIMMLICENIYKALHISLILYSASIMSNFENFWMIIYGFFPLTQKPLFCAFSTKGTSSQQSNASHCSLFWEPHICDRKHACTFAYLSHLHIHVSGGTLQDSLRDIFYFLFFARLISFWCKHGKIPVHGTQAALFAVLLQNVYYKHEF